MSPSMNQEEEVEVVEEEVRTEDLDQYADGQKIKQYFTANGYQTSMGQYSKGCLKNDQYFKSINDFIDDKLNLVGEMVAHKKTQQEIKRRNIDDLNSIRLENDKQLFKSNELVS